MQKLTRPGSIALLAAALLFGSACLCTPTGLLTTATPILPPAATSAGTLPPPDLGGTGQTAQGPWLLFSGANGLAVINTDGSGWTQITQEPFWQGNLKAALQPGGNLLAVLSSSGDQVHALTLNIFSLPGGELQGSIPLTTPATEPGAEFMPGEPAFEAVRAIAYNQSLAWSPDGSRLAFIGILDGPDAEVYLYEVGSRTTRRVSTDDAQNYSPSFSPDGSRLLYIGAYSFGTGAGFAMAGVWSANGDGSNVTWLFEPESSGEELVGWRDGSTAVLASWNVMCGTKNLRLYSLATSQTIPLYEDCFGSAAVGSYAGSPGAVLFSTPEGVFMLPSDSQEVIHLDGRLAHDLRWDPVGVQFVLPMIESPMETLSPDAVWGEPAPTTAEDVAAFGMIWAWTSRYGELPGVWISGPGMQIGQVFVQPAYAPTWDENDNTLFFFSDSVSDTGLYRLTFPNYNDPTLLLNLPDPVEEVLWVAGD